MPSGLDILEVRATQPRRLRVYFSSPLATSAYNAALYSLICQDDSGTDPPVRAVYAVSGTPQCVELVLGADLVGAPYLLSAGNVMALNSTGTPAGTTYPFTYGSVLTQSNVETLVDDTEVYLYKRDIVWSGEDFEEGADGDLAVVQGVQNAESAINRRLLGSPLPYNPYYSPNAREFVDGNNAAPLALRLRAQALRDPRVQAVRVEPTVDESGNVIFQITTTLVGNRQAAPISVTVQS